MKPTAPGTDSQLAGIRVVDLTRILSGPFCTMLLADLGADVIKIETPDGGDSVRRQGAVRDGLSWYFAAFNRNKRSVVLDLRAAEGKALLERLIASADVVVENYRAGVLEEMGFRLRPAPRDQARHRRVQHLGLRPDRAVPRPARLRLHRPGDERAHERQRRGGRAAAPERAAAHRPRGRALRRPRRGRRARAPPAHRRAGAGGHRHARRARELRRVHRRRDARHRPAAPPLGQRPPDRGAVRPLRGGGRRHRHRSRQRSGLPPPARRAGPHRAEGASGLRDERAARPAPRAHQRAGGRAHRARHAGGVDRAL